MNQINHEERPEDESLVQKTMNVIKNRTRPKYAKCPSPLCPRKYKASAIKVGGAKISKELDVLTYFRKLKMLETLLHVIFNKNEKYLLKN